MNAPVSRRALLRAGSAALGAAMVPTMVGAPVAADPSVSALPLAFDPAAFIADLRAAGYGVVAYYDVPRGGEPPGPSRYLISAPKGGGFGAAYTAVMAKWWDAIEACPDHVEQVADYVFGQARKAAS